MNLSLSPPSVSSPHSWKIDMKLNRCFLNQFITIKSCCYHQELSELTSFFPYRSKLFLLPPGRQSGIFKYLNIWQKHIAACLYLHVLLIIAVSCPVSITTWWWLLQRLHRPQPQRITTCYSIVSFPMGRLRCYGNSQAHLGAARWQPPMEAAIAAAPVVWCRLAVCGTVTKTESETETGTATPSQDCRGPRWKLQQRQPFMAPYLMLSLWTRSSLN